MEDPGYPQEVRSRLVLTDGGPHPLILSSPRQAIELELALNKSPYGHAWKHIGNVLYEFGVGQPTVSTLTLTHFQLVFLKTLLSERDGHT